MRWRSIVLWCLAFVGVATGAFFIGHLIGFGSHCFVALAIALILQIWIYRSRWLAKFVRDNGAHFSSKEKKEQREVLASGPFEPALPLITISEDTYFVDPEHRKYAPGNRRDFHNYEFQGWFHALIPGILMCGVIFLMIWFALYTGICQYIEGTCVMRGDTKDVLGLVGMPCLMLLLIGAMAHFTSLLKPALNDFRQSGALNKLLHLNRIRRIQERGIPLMGQAVWFTRSNIPTRPEVFVLIFQYAFINPNGHQRMGVVYYRKQGGYPAPMPGVPLVVMYVDDDCHMPL